MITAQFTDLTTALSALLDLDQGAPAKVTMLDGLACEWSDWHNDGSTDYPVVVRDTVGSIVKTLDSIIWGS